MRAIRAMAALSLALGAGVGPVCLGVARAAPSAVSPWLGDPPPPSALQPPGPAVYAVPPWSLVISVGAGGSVELVAADQPTLGWPVVTVALERRLGASGVFVGAHIELAWWLMYHGRVQAGALLGYELPVLRERWWLYASVAGGYAGVGRYESTFGHGPFARLELGFKFRPGCLATGPRCLRGELRVGPTLQGTSLSYDTHAGDVAGWRLSAALLFGVALNF